MLFQLAERAHKPDDSRQRFTIAVLILWWFIPQCLSTWMCKLVLFGNTNMIHCCSKQTSCHNNYTRRCMLLVRGKGWDVEISPSEPTWMPTGHPLHGTLPLTLQPNRTIYLYTPFSPTFIACILTFQRGCVLYIFIQMSKCLRNYIPCQRLICFVLISLWVSPPESVSVKSGPAAFRDST